MKSPHIIAAVALLASVAGGAWAQSAGTFQVRLGVTNISPSVSSGDLSPPSWPGTKVDIKGSTQLGGGIAYMLTDHLALDLPLALPFTHGTYGAGAIDGVGKIGQTKAMPFTLLMQYRFGQANARFRPYVGGGVTYAKFYKERSTNVLTALTGGTPDNPTTMRIGSKFAPTLVIGGIFAFNDHWFAEGMIGKTFLKTTTTLSTGQSINTRLNPTTVSLGIGYRF
ncbi:MAG: outer membrane beta-barrel protein [Burkholderiaceae bacterium]|jgi:outer membrane protein|nr:outer membrane beta-barrel protein [Burkholderiaceae bacterium]